MVGHRRRRAAGPQRAQVGERTGANQCPVPATTTCIAPSRDWVPSAQQKAEASTSEGVSKRRAAPKGSDDGTKVTPRTVQSGSRSRGAKTGMGNPYLKGLLGEAAAAAIGTDTFLGAPHRRLVKRTGKLKALVAIERSILVIVWHLLSDPSARFIDLGSDFYERRVDTDRKTRDLVRQLRALGHELTLSPAV